MNFISFRTISFNVNQILDILRRNTNQIHQQFYVKASIKLQKNLLESSIKSFTKNCYATHKRSYSLPSLEHLNHCTSNRIRTYFSTFGYHQLTLECHLLATKSIVKQFVQFFFLAQSNWNREQVQCFASITFLFLHFQSPASHIRIIGYAEQHEQQIPQRSVQKAVGFIQVSWEQIKLEAYRVLHSVAAIKFESLTVPCHWW